VPYSCLNYIFAEVNYGGRVTDNKDTRLIIALLSRYFNPEVLETKNYKFSESDLYKSPEDLSLSSVKDYINNLPLKDQPEIFGLHQNANIVY
jgi:dynein heavy chain